MTLKEELFTTAKEIVEKRKQEQKQAEEERLLKNFLNTEQVWENFIKPTLINIAQKGEFSYNFYFTLNSSYETLKSDSTLYISTNKPYEYYNKILNMPYDFTILKNSHFNLDALIEIIKSNDLIYKQEIKPLAYSKASKYYNKNGYILFTIYWKQPETTTKTNITIIENSSIKKERNKVTAGLRYDILHRDNFRCQLCGRTQADGVKLHIDHIIPISKGGKSTPDNLRTLCQDCNLGKGVKIE